MKKALLFVGFMLSLMPFCWGVEGPYKLRRACLDRTDSTVFLIWNRPSDVCGSFTHFTVYGRPNALNVYSILFNSTDYSVSNANIKLPNLQQWEFFLVYGASCNGTDSLNSDTLKVDITEPDLLELDSVSVDPFTNKILIGWQQSTASDVSGYVVYHVTGSNSIIHTTGNLFYEDQSSNRNPDNNSYNFSLAAFDSCDNRSPISPDHRTIFLSSVLNVCSRNITISWTPYKGWAVSEYDIFLSTASGPYLKVGSVVSNFSSFVFNYPDDDTRYCFYVRARKSGSLISSSSNLNCITTPEYISPSFFHISKVTVTDGDEIHVQGLYDNQATDDSLYLERKDSKPGSVYSRIHLFTKPFNTLLNYIDKNVSVHSEVYYYRYVSKDACEGHKAWSNESHNIVLNVDGGSPPVNTITHGDYHSWQLGVDQYQLLFSPGLNSIYSSTWNIVSSSPTSGSIQDIREVSLTQPELCYCVRAIENGPNDFQRIDTSYSNKRCVLFEPSVFFPNAIQLNGFNNVFRPEGTHIDLQQSSFQIFSRWGELLYETNQIDLGWDGKNFNGIVVNEGVYVYKSLITGKNGTVVKFSGTITVLK